MFADDGSYYPELVAAEERSQAQDGSSLGIVVREAAAVGSASYNNSYGRYWRGVVQLAELVTDAAGPFPRPILRAEHHWRVQFAHLQLLRDVIGNPFRPVAFAPTWRTSTAVAIARSMYEARDFSPMPVLADALEEAGSDDPEVLAHCRGDGPHVRGCWVVDAVLGKA